MIYLWVYQYNKEEYSAINGIEFAKVKMVDNFLASEAICF